MAHKTLFRKDKRMNNRDRLIYLTYVWMRDADLAETSETEEYLRNHLVNLASSAERKYESPERLKFCERIVDGAIAEALGNISGFLSPGLTSKEAEEVMSKRESLT